MNIKEQIVEILKNCNKETGFEDVSSEPMWCADQILDLVLNSLTIEKKELRECTVEGIPMCYICENYLSGCEIVQESMAWNSCIDAYEELKNKLRK